MNKLMNKKMDIFTAIAATAAVISAVSCSTAPTHVALTDAKASRKISSSRHGYDGPDPKGVDYRQGRPRDYAGCDDYKNGPGREVLACEAGREEAEKMADKFAGGQGRIQGYFRGYSWGLHTSTIDNEKDPTYLATGAAIADQMGSQMQPGVSDAQGAGTNQAATDGPSDAIARFSKVIDTGQEPDKQINVPATSYAGEDNGYARLVGPVPSPGWILQHEINPAFSSVHVVDGWQDDDQYMGPRQKINPWDLDRDDGQYEFRKDEFMDSEKAFQTWAQRLVDGKRKYDGLNTPPLMNGTVQLNLQDVFKKAFVENYKNYAEYYYNQSFKQGMDDGEDQGFAVGELVGQHLAQYLGTQQEFNTQLRLKEVAGFRSNYASEYRSTFTSTYNDYMGNAKLQVTFNRVVGVPDVGVLPPGTTISANFGVKNYGGKDADLTATVTGDVQGATTYTSHIDRLKSGSYTAASVAQVDPRIGNNKVARVILTVNGQAAELDETMQQILQVGAPHVTSLSSSNGSGIITVSVKNISLVNTPGNVTVALSLNGRAIDPKTVDLIEKGDTHDFVIAFDGVDPLDIINGTVAAKAVVMMNGKAIEQSSGSVTVSNPTADLAAYFNALVNGAGFVPASTDRDNRIASVTNTLTKNNEKDVQYYRRAVDENVWKDAPTTTTLGELVDQFHATAQSADAKLKYDALAQTMWASRKEFRRVLFIFKSGKRKLYDALVQELSLNGKLK